MHTLWRGNANAWECDELGHLNVRFYIAKAAEAAGALADRIGMRQAFTRRAVSTLIARELTVRFLAEARPGSPLAIRGGVTAHDETSLQAVLILDHCARGAPAATFTVRLDHADPVTGKAFPWSSRTREALEALTTDAPAEAKARSLSLEPGEQNVSLERAGALGMKPLGLGRINADEVDVFGRMRPEFAIAKVSDSFIHLHGVFPEQWAAHVSGENPASAVAVLEARILFHHFPLAGQGYDIRSGLAAATSNVRTIVHWAFDTHKGAPLWTMQVVGGLIDLKTRRLTPTDPQMLEAMKAGIIEDLRP